MAANPDIIRHVEEGQGLETRFYGVMSSQLSSAEAERNLTRDLVRRMDGQFAKYGRDGSLALRREITAGVISDAIRYFNRTHKGTTARPILSAENSLTISFNSP